jgi:hypothetical protein
MQYAFIQLLLKGKLMFLLSFFFSQQTNKFSFLIDPILVERNSFTILLLEYRYIGEIYLQVDPLSCYLLVT